jgi:broad specificity phosphatase PhoE
VSRLLALALLAAGIPELGPVPAATVRVALVRHGQALSNLDPTPDLPEAQLDHLTDLGREQAQKAAAALARFSVAAMLSSPASRARETAQLMAARLGTPAPRLEPRARPLDLGRGPDGAPLDWDARIADWEAGRDPVPPGGESMELLGRRVLELVQSLAAEHAGRTVVVVAHSEVIGAFLGQLDGTPGAKRYPPKVPNGSLTIVEADGTAAPRLLARAIVP